MNDMRDRERPRDVRFSLLGVGRARALGFIPQQSTLLKRSFGF